VTPPIRSDLAGAQTESWARLGRPGTWWSAAERVAIAAEARAARRCELCVARKAALSPYGLPGRHEARGALAAPYVDAIHRVVTDPGRLTERWLDSMRVAGLEDERYVELVGVIITVMTIDVFRRALGLPEATLPEARPGEPSRRRPAAARRTVAWVPIVDPTDGLEEVYSSDGHVPLVRQALSLVPDEVRNLDRLEQTHYLPFDHVGDPASNAGRALTRPQIELVAARVSFLNDCFY
jgi:alkylhydroperoxidase family enzyme